MEQKIVDALKNLDAEGKKLHEEALKEGYKDELCPKCGVVFLAHHHFIRCDEKDCPMSNGKNFFEMMKEAIFNHKEFVKNVHKVKFWLHKEGIRTFDEFQKKLAIDGIYYNIVLKYGYNEKGEKTDSVCYCYEDYEEKCEEKCEERCEENQLENRSEELLKKIVEKLEEEYNS